MCKIYVVNQTNRLKFAAYLEEMHRQRYQIYVEQRQWSELESPLKLEIDEYDNSLATWLLAISDTGELQGGVRLVPSDCSTLLFDHFSFLASNMDIPNDPNIWEITRYYMMDNKAIAPDGHDVKRHLILGMLDYAQMSGVKGLFVVMDTGFLRMMEAFKWDYTPMGLPQRYENGECVAVSINLTTEMVERHRHMVNFWSHSVVLPGEDDLTHKQHNFVAEETRLLAKIIQNKPELVQPLTRYIADAGSMDPNKVSSALSNIECLLLESITEASSSRSLFTPDLQPVGAQFGSS